VGELVRGRAVIVTGAGRGIGRSHALALSREGAHVLVNDVGGAVDGSGTSSGPADEVVAEIRAAGGAAAANYDDVADWEGAKRVVDAALGAFGRLDGLVNNAGILRDRMLVNMSIDEWDAVIRVHLRGTFAMTRRTAEHWRTEAKSGRRPAARIINTSSGSGLYGNVGQANYAAAKAGIAALTTVAAGELGRYGVTVNAIAPAALTRMTEPVGLGQRAQAEAEAAGFDVYSPDNIAPLVVWLASAASAHVTGRVFDLRGGRISIADGWRPGPEVDRRRAWRPEEIGAAVAELLERSPAPYRILAQEPAGA
jgi:NAD(P)-dependent dehydrogenase (short-subunit alcohol dehydrogenase family)